MKEAPAAAIERCLARLLPSPCPRTLLAAFCLLWVTWSRWGAQLLTRESNAGCPRRCSAHLAAVSCRNQLFGAQPACLPASQLPRSQCMPAGLPPPLLVASTAAWCPSCLQSWDTCCPSIWRLC